MREIIEKIIKPTAKGRTICAEQYGYINYHASSFFAPYDSVEKARAAVKVIVFRPLIDVYLTIVFTEKALLDLGCGLMNLAFGIFTLSLKDLTTGGHNLLAGVINLINAIVCAVAIIVEPLESILHLMTRSLCTIGLGLLAVGKKAGEYLTPLGSMIPNAFGFSAGA